MAESYPELTSPIKANYPQSLWKILNRQFMQVFLFLLLSLHLLSLQLPSLFKLSFVIIKQQCKQLSQKPLPKLLEMISSVLFMAGKKKKKNHFPQWRPLHPSLWILNILLLKLREWSTGLFCLALRTNTHAKRSKLPTWLTVGGHWNSQEAPTSRRVNEWKSPLKLKSQQLLNYSFHMAIF